MRKQKLNKKIFLPLVLVVIIGGYIYYFLCTSEIFYLSQVEIRTTGSVDESIVKECASLTNKTRIFGLNLNKVSRKLEDLPQVKKAAVSKVFPDKLIVRIQEREPIAQIRLGQYYLVDREGVILPSVTPLPASNLPLLIGTDLRKDSINIGRKYESERLAGALQLLETLFSSTQLAKEDIDSVNIRVFDNVIVTTRKDSIKIRLGQEGLKDKIVLLDQALRDIYSTSRKVRSIDLRFGEVIVKER